MESMLARGELPDSARAGVSWPEDLAEIIHIDHYGNGISGLRATTLSTEQAIRAGGEVLKYARVFSEVPPGAAFWYENANGLVEIAVNGGSVAARLGLRPGDPLTLIQP